MQYVPFLLESSLRDEAAQLFGRLYLITRRFLIRRQLVRNTRAFCFHCMRVLYILLLFAYFIVSALSKFRVSCSLKFRRPTVHRAFPSLNIQQSV